MTVKLFNIVIEQQLMDDFDKKLIENNEKTRAKAMRKLMLEYIGDKSVDRAENQVLAVLREYSNKKGKPYLEVLRQLKTFYSKRIADASSES